ncbi:hypothetical protein GB928_023430 [Shinella curvata]|uniref:Uncharacterized protein n=1 Tax=Shinella curvata TaxID=1817964 RepID=A0ABT8XKA5_9HYPH|nr:hypothetical protein [Shinella curvata]MCJ8056821.1 hypothetical protein [Shinella curvata]MDO6124156.1 hypothetical protein [Shinella curvata]
MQNLQQFAMSSNGDRWFLGKRAGDGEAIVLHRANPSSGGHETETLVADFLNIRPFGPEREALIELLGVGDDAGDPKQESYTSSSQ